MVGDLSIRNADDFDLKAVVDLAYCKAPYPVVWAVSSNGKLLGNLAGMAWNDLPLDYLDTWTQQVQKVSVADIKAAFGRKLQPEKMVTVILGAAK